jgi:uncharacterized protein
MQITTVIDPALNFVRAYSSAEIVIGERIMRSSLVVTARDLIADWPPRSIADLTEAHLAAVLALEPQVVLLGTGARQRFPEARILAAAAGAGIGVEVMDTAAACRTYNVLLAEERRVAAALILERNFEASR